MTDDNIKRINDWLAYIRKGMLGLYAGVLALMILFLLMFILMEQEVRTQQMETLQLENNQLKVLNVQQGIIDILAKEIKK